jgi:hypothetical protein
MAAPHRSLSMDMLRRNSLTIWPGMTIFWIGDPAHMTGVSGHNPDDTPGVRAELTDADSDPEVRSLDFMIGPVFTTEQGWRLVNALVNGVDRNRLYYVIYRSTIWSRSTGFKARPYSGFNHNDHVHVSGWAADDENGSDWSSVLALDEEEEVPEVYYKIQSTDGVWNGQVYVSNRINSRKLRNPGAIQNAAKHGAVEVILTDAMRLSVGSSTTWENYISAVAGPPFPELVCNCAGGGAHAHDVTGSTGPATPSG